MDATILVIFRTGDARSNIGHHNTENFMTWPSQAAQATALTVALPSVTPVVAASAPHHYLEPPVAPHANVPIPHHSPPLSSKLPLQHPAQCAFNARCAAGANWDAVAQYVDMSSKLPRFDPPPGGFEPPHDKPGELLQVSVPAHTAGLVLVFETWRAGWRSASRFKPMRLRVRL